MEKYDAQEGNNQDGATALGSTMDSGYIGVDPRTPSNPAIQVWESAAMTPIRVTCRLHIPGLYAFVESEGFNNAIMAAIVANTIVMMTRHYPESEKFDTANVIMEWYVFYFPNPAFTFYLSAGDCCLYIAIYKTDTFFLCIARIFNGVFLCEFLIKHLGYGIAGYWSVPWNRLDGVVVLSSVVDMISPLLGAGVDLGFMRALRVLRVMRAVRVLKAAPEAMAVMNAMVVSLSSMGGFLLVWLIFMLIYALLGTRLYGGACVFELDEDAGRLSFNSFTRAMLTLFVTASGEDGFDVMHWQMEAGGNISSLFMISWMIISQIILSLLLALLIDTYSVDEDEEETEDPEFVGGVFGSGGALVDRKSIDMHGAKGENKSLSKHEQLNRDLIDFEEVRDADMARQKSDATGVDGDCGDAQRAVFSKSKHGGGKSAKSGATAKSGRSMERHQEKKLTAALASGDLNPEEEKVSRSRLQMLQDLRDRRKVRPWPFTKSRFPVCSYNTDTLSLQSRCKKSRSYGSGFSTSRWSSPRLTKTVWKVPTRSCP